MFIAVLITSTAFAQPIKDQREAELQQINEQRGNRQERGERPERSKRYDGQKPQQMRQQKDNSVSVEGTLKLEKGFVAVESGDTVYLVPMLNRYIGFIGGLKEGGKVTVEGQGFRNMIQPLKVTIDGKSYDFIVPQHRAVSRGSDKAFGKHDNKKYGQKFDHGGKCGHDKGSRRYR
jgi:hypothetical protein